MINTDKSDNTDTEAKALRILDEDPELKAVVLRLRECIEKFTELNEKILPAQTRGLTIPNVEQLVYNAQQNLAAALDAVGDVAKKSTSEEAVKICMELHTIGVQYFQGIYFGIQYTAIRMKFTDRVFQRLLHQAYKMLEKTQKSPITL